MFAHTFPYTSSDLNVYLNGLFSTAPQKIGEIMSRTELTTTLAKNRCDLLTITSPTPTNI